MYAYYCNFYYSLAKKNDSNPTFVHHCGLVVSVPAWDGTGREFDSW